MRETTMRKSILVKNLFVALAAMLLGPVFSTAPAQAEITATTRISAIQLKGLPADKAISVFYVNARESALGTVGQTLKIRAIKQGPVLMQTEKKASLNLPAVEIKTFGFDIPNFVVFVVHSADKKAVYLRNSDGSLPDDPRLPGGDAGALGTDDFQYDKMHFISTLKMNRLKVIQGNPEFVELDLAEL